MWADIGLAVRALPSALFDKVLDWYQSPAEARYWRDVAERLRVERDYYRDALYEEKPWLIFKEFGS